MMRRDSGRDQSMNNVIKLVDPRRSRKSPPGLGSRERMRQEEQKKVTRASEKKAARLWVWSLRRCHQ